MSLPPAQTEPRPTGLPRVHSAGLEEHNHQVSPADSAQDKPAGITFKIDEDELLVFLYRAHATRPARYRSRACHKNRLIAKAQKGR